MKASDRVAEKRRARPAITVSARRHKWFSLFGAVVIAAVFVSWGVPAVHGARVVLLIESRASIYQQAALGFDSARRAEI